MPGARVLRDRALRTVVRSVDVHPDSIPLYLPSAIRLDSFCPATLCNYEWRLRHAQANDALDDIRHNLRFRSHLYKFKDSFVRGQRGNTRSRGTIQRVQDKVDAAAKKYQIAHTALLSLAPRAAEAVAEHPRWEQVLKRMDVERDVKSMTEAGYHLKEGKRKLSWIWLTPGVAADVEGEEGGEGIHDGQYVVCCIYHIWRHSQGSHM
jgi:hypothetical protein